MNEDSAIRNRVPPSGARGRSQLHDSVDTDGRDKRGDDGVSCSAIP